MPLIFPFNLESIAIILKPSMRLKCLLWSCQLKQVFKWTEKTAGHQLNPQIFYWLKHLFKNGYYHTPSYCFCVLWQDWPVHALVHLEPTAGQSGWIETTLQEVVTGKLRDFPSNQVCPQPVGIECQTTSGQSYQSTGMYRIYVYMHMQRKKNRM